MKTLVGLIAAVTMVFGMVSVGKCQDISGYSSIVLPASNTIFSCNIGANLAVTVHTQHYMTVTDIVPPFNPNGNVVVTGRGKGGVNGAVGNGNGFNLTLSADTNMDGDGIALTVEHYSQPTVMNIPDGLTQYTTFGLTDIQFGPAGYSLTLGGSSTGGFSTYAEG